MKLEAKCISAETQYLYANRCATIYELERKYCYEILKKEKLISLMPPLFGYVFFEFKLHSASRGQGRPGIITFRRHKCHFNVSVQ
ncbi:hypothetical protein T02_14176 [Trichinella nativa]|uniref:Uncharacterized protein n=1 Tax=Trichinella nativa TaxID=6335 RepID=A0A0V1LEJ2_9BILA|nr:hypothetical protein T02_14176 [Trichinella nativa]